MWPLVEGDGAVRDDAGDDAGLGLAGADGADAAVAIRDGVDLRGHFRGGEEGVLPAVHRRAAGVRGLAFEGNGPPFHAAGALHDGEGLAEIEKHRPLLDVELQVGGGVFLPGCGVLDLFEINPVRGDGIRQGDAVLVLQPARLVHVEVSGKSGGAEEAFPEARALLIRPIDDLDGDRWFSGKLLVDAAHDLHPGHDVQATVEPAAVRYGIDMAADEESFFRLTGEGEPEVSRGIRLGGDGKIRHFPFQPFPRLGPCFRESDALGAILIAGEGAEFLEFVDGAFGIGGGWHRDMGFSGEGDSSVPHAKIRALIAGPRLQSGCVSLHGKFRTVLHNAPHHRGAFRS